MSRSVAEAIHAAAMSARLMRGDEEMATARMCHSHGDRARGEEGSHTKARRHEGGDDGEQGSLLGEHVGWMSVGV